jgi:hypothetical protein
LRIYNITFLLIDFVTYDLNVECYQPALTQLWPVIIAALQVFECVIAWVHHDLEKRQMHLAELMEHVRLPLLSQEYLVQRVEEEPLLKDNLQC